MEKLLNRLDNQLAFAKEKKTYNKIKVIQTLNSAIVSINDKKYLNMCSNNYLGFASDPNSIAAAKNYIEKYGVGSGAVRSISGTQTCHIDLEKKLAQFKKVDNTIILQSGFQANTGLIPAIITKIDYVISDQLNHASIIDGVRLAGIPKPQRTIYKHIDMNDLESKLIVANKEISKEGIIYVLTDGVFSMDGDYAPLDKISELCEKYHAIPIVDDAHGEGVFGDHGRGLVDHFKLTGKFIEVGTLSKAFGVAGGFIGGPNTLIEFLKQKARPFLFSTSIDPALIGGAIHNIEEMENSDERVQKLWANTKYLKTKLKEMNISTGDSMSPITPIIVGEEWKATKLTKLLFDDGILVSPIIFPTVPKGKGRIRVIPSALHTQEHLDTLINCLRKNLKLL